MFQRMSGSTRRKQRDPGSSSCRNVCCQPSTGDCSLDELDVLGANHPNAFHYYYSEFTITLANELEKRSTQSVILAGNDLPWLLCPSIETIAPASPPASFAVIF